MIGEYMMVVRGQTHVDSLDILPVSVLASIPSVRRWRLGATRLVRLITTAAPHPAALRGLLLPSSSSPPYIYRLAPMLPGLISPRGVDLVFLFSDGDAWVVSRRAPLPAWAHLRCLPGGATWAVPCRRRLPFLGGRSGCVYPGYAALSRPPPMSAAAVFVSLPSACSSPVSSSGVMSFPYLGRHLGSALRFRAVTPSSPVPSCRCWLGRRLFLYLRSLCLPGVRSRRRLPPTLCRRRIWVPPRVRPTPPVVGPSA